ncbi:heat shock protein 40 [Hepatocystis sp. ex Piliocolobus tephrosceles]|nr:heat shock protein 40 [Hepatocystis sp. ex Piliocolobus tephrosceles]
MMALQFFKKGYTGKLLLERSFFTIALGDRNNNFLSTKSKKKCYSLFLTNYDKRNINISRRCLNQDPYTVLGLSKNATASDIKKQFRLLAKKYHPDINPSPDAKQKMANITAAYELLSDPKKKEFYDKTGMADDMNYDRSTSSSNFDRGFAGFGDASFMFTDFAEMFSNMAGNKNTSSTRGEDIQTEITLKFMEAIKGCEKNIKLNVKVSCNHCNGSGKKPGTNLSICKVCNGSGIQRMERGPIIIGVPCRNCSGNGQIINNPCKHCSGSGVKIQTKNITLDIPPGIKKGMQMRIPNQGHSGYRGGKNGHLFVTIDIEPHQTFKWIDDNIHVEIPLTIKQCLLGGIVSVPTLNGDMDLIVRPKTNPNSEKVLKGKGPSKVDSHTNGDLIIKFKLKMPEKLTPRQIELIEEFNRIELNLPNPNTSNINNKKKNNINMVNGIEQSGLNEKININMGINYAINNNSDNISKPPITSNTNKKRNVSNIDERDRSNVPIPPLPPKSSQKSSPNVSQNISPNVSTNKKKKEQNEMSSDREKIKNSSNELRNDNTEINSSNSKLYNNISNNLFNNINNKSENYTANKEEHNNSNLNTNNHTNKKLKKIIDNINNNETDEASYKMENISNKNDISDNSHQTDDEKTNEEYGDYKKKNDAFNSTISVAKKWIADKLKSKS